MITNIIVDLDGTLIENKNRHYQCYKDILLNLNQKPIDSNMYWHCIRNRVSKKAILKMSNSTTLHDYFMDEWFKRIELEEYLLHDIVHERVIQTLSVWKSEGIKIILSTLRKNKRALNEQLKFLKIFDFFDYICVSKNSNNFIKKANSVSNLKLDSLNKNNTVWIGDTEFDYLAAKHLKLKSCLVCNGIRTKKHNKKLGPDILLNTIAEFELTNNKI